MLDIERQIMLKYRKKVEHLLLILNKGEADFEERKEAEKYDMTIEQYCDRFELAEGDCPSEKIEAVREEEEKEQDIDEAEKREDRGERPTPEEEALDRLLNRH